MVKEVKGNDGVVFSELLLKYSKITAAFSKSMKSYEQFGTLAEYLVGQGKWANGNLFVHFDDGRICKAKCQ